MNTNSAHRQLLLQELKWLEQVISTRFQLHFNQESDHQSIQSIVCPSLDDLDCKYSQIIKFHHFGWEERLVLILAQTAHLAPQLLDPFFAVNRITDQPYTEFGGYTSKRHRGFLPTLETALFLLAGTDLEQRFQVHTIFDQDHPFHRDHILERKLPADGAPIWSSPLILSKGFQAQLSYNRPYESSQGILFPATKITTLLDSEDLILEESLKKELNEIGTWVQHQNTILDEWDFKRHLKPGYKVLFYGAPGTGKSLSAALLGKMTGHDVYRVDLSLIGSKYIGETEKNLNRVFDSALQNNWILFFDEADALFGRRITSKKTKSRSSNQDMAFLLQKIEDYPGVIVISHSKKINIDQAFARRFQSILHFPMPNAQQRLQLWKTIFSAHPILDESVQLEQLAIRYELSGGAISNILRQASLIAIGRSNKMVNQRDIEVAIRREFNQDIEGRTLT